jgi:ribonuclease P protein component
MTDYAKADISAEQSSPRQDARVQGTDGDKERSSGAEKTPGQGAQAPHAGSLLNQHCPYPKRVRLRKPIEFRQVYAHGRRYDGGLMTAFVLGNSLEYHRMGVTASRKLAKGAVERNRAKRLLREAFRLCATELSDLRAKYDWVLNARRSLLDTQVANSLEDFRKIIARVWQDENGGGGANQAIKR